MTTAEDRPVATRLLFVCTANLCRSPFLEHYARARLRPAYTGAIEVASAGTHAEPGLPADQEILDVLAGLGVDGAAHRSRALDRDLLAWADLIVTADGGHRGWILDEVPARFPRVWTLGQLRAALARLDDGGAADPLAAAVAVRGPTGPATDVADPFGQGSEAVEASAVLMREWLEEVLIGLGLAEPIDHPRATAEP